MTAVYIILGILLFFFLLSLLRIGVRADFAGDLADTRVTVIAGVKSLNVSIWRSVEDTNSDTSGESATARWLH